MSCEGASAHGSRAPPQSRDKGAVCDASVSMRHNYLLGLRSSARDKRGHTWTFAHAYRERKTETSESALNSLV